MEVSNKLILHHFRTDLKNGLDCQKV